MKKLIISLLLLPSILWASEGKVSITWLAANGDFAPQIIVVKALNQILETEANSQLPEITADEYTDGLYHSQLISTSTIDGSSQYKTSQYELSINSSAGWRGGSFSDVLNDPASIKGIGVSSSVGLAYKINEFFTLNMGLMNMSIPSISDGLTGKMKTYQLMATYQLINATADKLWSGLTISTGIVKNSLAVNLHVDIDETASEALITGYLKGSANVEIKTEITTIPIFLTTGISAFNFINLYTSLGGHLSKGESSVSALLLADVTYDNANSTSEAHYSLTGYQSEELSFKPTLLIGTRFLLLNHFNLGLQYAKMSEDSSLGLNISFPF